MFSALIQNILNITLAQVGELVVLTPLGGNDLKPQPAEVGFVFLVKKVEIAYIKLPYST